MPVEVKPLPYAYDALEPTIDEKTMKLHHDKHYASYVEKYNAAVAKAPELEGKALDEVLANDLAMVPEDVKTTVRNNGGGAHNHALFWEIMGSPDTAGGEPKGELAAAINKAFGSFEDFQAEFSAAAATRFGSGWAWLVKDGEALKVISTPNQDSPIMQNMFPVMGLDVWEHAYYLTYNNRRPDYVEAWWSVVDWEAVGERFERAE